MKRLVIGITAHVDSGKTTLSEAMLFRTGEIRKLGRVDHQTAFLDTHPMEQDRGITIFAHQAEMQYADAEYTLLDTPGHVDFSTETERTMQVLDAAILVISGTDGVQSHTETLWKLLKRYGIPVFVFVNKMDLNGADHAKVLSELKTRLGEACTDFSEEQTEHFYESIAMLEEAWMEEYLENSSISQKSICEGVKARKIVPCYFGSALKLDGVDAFLTGLHRYTLEKSYDEAFGARVFKISADEKGNRLSYLKITGGTLRVRDTIRVQTADGKEISEKVSQIRFYAGAKFRTEELALSGMVCAVTGLSHTYAGQGLGTERDAERPVLEPVMHFAVRLPAGVHASDALQALTQLEEEDPSLHVLWNDALQEIQIQLMGEVQLEVLQRLMQERFGFAVTFDAGQIRYKETIADCVEGVGHYEPLCHYAEVHLRMEPLPAGSGLQFATECREDDLNRNWQRLILTHLGEKTHIGVLTGSPITDMRITLCSGRAHIKHTEGGDFRQATYRAVRNGLRKAKSVLLEPWYDFVLEVPMGDVGRAMTDLQQMHGNFEPPETVGEHSVLRGSAPVASMQGYPRVVTSYTRGVGRLVCSIKGYAPCENAEAVIAEIGYDCDSDLENSADSIFCAHGAGFAVKWDAVQEHMHLPSCLTTPKEIAPQPQPIRKKHSGSYDSFAADKELMAIFERTYGKIQRDTRSALRTSKEDLPTYAGASQTVYQGEEYLLVDGYNIIFAWDELKELAKDNLDAARSRLTHILCNYCGYRQCKLILVFDAYKVKGAHREIEQYYNISIVYTKESETADSYIEKTTHELGKENHVRVATSDGMEQMIILGNGALRVSADEFYQEVKQAERAILEYTSQMKTGKKTIRVEKKK